LLIAKIISILRKSFPHYENHFTNKILQVTNPNSDPAMNIWRIRAHTATAFGVETWAIAGYKIFPELTQANIESSNPGEEKISELTQAKIESSNPGGELGTATIMRVSGYNNVNNFENLDYIRCF
jgi:hypothetical protein